MGKRRIEREREQSPTIPTSVQKLHTIQMRHLFQLVAPPPSLSGILSPCPGPIPVELKFSLHKAFGARVSRNGGSERPHLLQARSDVFPLCYVSNNKE